jgi:uncharacterized paraquat-inducible protein A
VSYREENGQVILCEDCEMREATWETMDSRETSLCSECVTRRVTVFLHSKAEGGER